MIKLIAFDIDGTLVGKKNNVSEKNRAAISRARSQGIKIALATGRNVAGLRCVAEQIKCEKNNDYIVGLNGGIVFKFKSDGVEFVNEVSFTPEQVQNVFALAKQYKMNVVAYVQGEDFVLTNKKRGFFAWFMKKRLKSEFLMYDQDKFKTTSAYKFIAFGKKKTAMPFREEMIRLKYETFAFSYVTNSHQNIEVNPTGVDKAYGLQQIEKIYGIKPDEVLFFGDGENDIAALKHAGIGVAMENAKEKVKKHANFIAGHHLKNGVGEMINQYLDNIKK
jgi:Cof subfamily protein (haloacid dehalogenase superfamily)